MPCLLRTMQSQEVDQEVDRYQVTSPASGVAPLAIHFSTEWIPCGVFCSLVAFLRSSQNPSPWCFFPHPKNTTEPQCLTRNCIKFQLPEGAPGSLTLIDAFSHFEVHVNAPYDVRSSLCPSIWHTLIEGIQKAAETLKYSQLVPKQAFLCKHENTQPHLALPADAFNYWTCELKPDTVYGHLTDEHLVWCPEKGPKKEVNLSLETPTEVTEGQQPLEEAQPSTVSQKHKRGAASQKEVHLSLEIHSEVDEGHPTVLECIRFQGKERTINIPEEIGTSYCQFGIFLLDDPNGTRTRNIEHKHREHAEKINREILREWATGRGKNPVSWKTLSDVLRDIELGTLASEIEAVKML